MCKENGGAGGVDVINFDVTGRVIRDVRSTRNVCRFTLIQ